MSHPIQVSYPRPFHTIHSNPATSFNFPPSCDIPIHSVPPCSIPSIRSNSAAYLYFFGSHRATPQYIPIPLHSIHSVQSRHVPLFCSYTATSQYIQSNPTTSLHFAPIPRNPNPVNPIPLHSIHLDFTISRSFPVILLHPNPFNIIPLHPIQSVKSCHIPLFFSHPAISLSTRSNSITFCSFTTTLLPIHSIQSCTSHSIDAIPPQLHYFIPLHLFHSVNPATSFYLLPTSILLHSNPCEKTFCFLRMSS
jgi:hypothetical protein